MNIRLSNIILVMAGFTLLSSRSCEPESLYPEDSGRLARKQDSLKQEFRNDFESDYLTDEQLFTFEERGKQKLFDFADMLTLYAEQDLDTVFRQQIHGMLMNLFVNDDSPVLIWPLKDEPVAEPCRLADLLNEIDKHNYTSAKYSIRQIKIIEPLHTDGFERYTGTLAGTFQITGLSGEDTLVTKETVKHVQILVTKTRKSFGSGVYREVWQVFLRGME